MKFPLLDRIKQPLSNALKRPLTAPEAAMAASVILLFATIYCQIYCLVAFQEMHGRVMPVTSSIHRVAIDTLPAFAAFELSKRALWRRRGAIKIVQAILIFCAAIAVASVARTTFTMMTDPTTPIRKIVADRLPTFAAAALTLAWMQMEARRRAGLGEPVTKAGETATLPPAKFIDWVRAAGNYVEVHFAGRTRLLRMSLRQTAAQLPEEHFVQVHRSIIVNRACIASHNGRRSICLMRIARISKTRDQSSLRPLPVIDLSLRPIFVAPVRQA
jgi:hypothetical protein